CARAAYIHPSASLFGKISLGEGVTVWPNAVVRAEAHAVEVDDYANIQDFVMVHIDYSQGVYIGKHVSLAHHCTVHGARVEANALIGISATVMDRAVIGENSLIAAGAVVTADTVIPPNSIAVGAPAKVIKERNNWIDNHLNALFYYRNGLAYARDHHRAWTGDEYEDWLVDERKRLEAEFKTRWG
ncbi:MAG: gamma carbonic anhydrase family protein, partial [Pseudomonadota bacterium]